MEYTERMKKGYDSFLKGYNCTQSVILAFSDLIDVDTDTALRLASSFGGGMARMREVCGAVSGIFMVAGILFGYSSPNDRQSKLEHYAFIRRLADDFKAINGSIICRELLTGIQTKPGNEPEERTEEYYHKRPCAQYIAECIGVLEREIERKKTC